MKGQTSNGVKRVEIRSVMVEPSELRKIDRCAERLKWSRAQYALEAIREKVARDRAQEQNAA